MNSVKTAAETIEATAAARPNQILLVAKPTRKPAPDESAAMKYDKSGFMMRIGPYFVIVHSCWRYTSEE
jgi:hypothetical protein